MSVTSSFHFEIKLSLIRSLSLRICGNHRTFFLNTDVNLFTLLNKNNLTFIEFGELVREKQTWEIR